ncbi:MAG: VOC family protein [Ruminococcaceae bacterium]|nr:VOC family protein [Oscillospiraceae bacterium]
MITKIGHMALKVKDLEASCRFYMDVLGFQEAFKLYNDEGQVSICYLHIAAGQFIELFPNGQGTYAYAAEAVGPSHICYEVNDIEKALKHISEKGVPIDSPVKKGKSGCLQFWIKDPDGNRIELMELPVDSLQAKAKKALGY